MGEETLLQKGPSPTKHFNLTALWRLAEPVSALVHNATRLAERARQLLLAGGDLACLVGEAVEARPDGKALVLR